MNISIIIPCFNEETALPIFYKEITKKLLTMSDDYELIFIDDGSIDNTLNEIKKLKENDKRIKYISFSRNFGKESAMIAGLEQSTGNYVVIMDVDLQDPISLLPKMYEAVTKEGYDCAGARRTSRKGENFIRAICSNIFYKIVRNWFNINLVDGVRDYRLMNRAMVNAVLSLKEKARFSKGLFTWVGFNTKYFEFENINRVAGKTKWSFIELVFYSIDGILSFSNIPIYLVSGFSLVFFAVSILMIMYILVRTFLIGNATPGWPSLVCIIFFTSSIQLLSLGIIGQYIAKTFIESKERPLYIVKEQA